MVVFLRRLARFLPTLLTAFLLAGAVWISAVSSNDPLEQRTYSPAVPIEIIGQDSNLVITSDIPETVTVVLSAPQSVWSQELNDPNVIRAILDLSGLNSGRHTLPVQIQITPRSVRRVSQSPQTIQVELEQLATQEFPIIVVTRGNPATGYQAEEPSLSRTTVMVTGPESLVSQVSEVRAMVDIDQITENVNRSLNLEAFDASANLVEGLTLVPDRVTVSQVISQRFGYRNVVVKVVVTGQVADGYRLTNISVFPPAVTVFSSNPQIVSDLPGFIETDPVNINSLKDDRDVSVGLSLPEGVLVVGDQIEVLVRVGVAAIESSLTLPNVPVEVTGLGPGLTAAISPENVTVILSGPVALIDRLQATDVRLVVDLTDYVAGTYQVQPEIEVLISELQVESILPENVEIVITRGTSNRSSTP